MMGSFVLRLCNSSLASGNRLPRLCNRLPEMKSLKILLLIACSGYETHCVATYRLVEPVQVIEVTSSEEDPEEDLEELPPEPAVDALDFLEGDEDPLLEVDSPEEVMSASEADSTEDSGPGEMATSGGSSS
ncbi:hypothetical protein GmHk_08G023377 [Glycine max]|nr:hypothetical protein GmHk_08G023377 [Glycine max]